MSGIAESNEPIFVPTAAWLRACFAAERVAAVSAIQNSVTGFDPTLREQTPKSEPLTAAAVLVPLVLRETGITVLLTQRTEHLRDHAGQISFPGGRSEESDLTPLKTALREAEEEVGLDPAQVEILGVLSEYSTVSGYTITPVVALVSPPLNLKLDDFEVAEVFEVPLAFLLDARNHQHHRVEYQGAMREYYAMPWEGYFIWGATAGMLVTLQRFLFAQD